MVLKWSGNGIYGDLGPGYNDFADLITFSSINILIWQRTKCVPLSAQLVVCSLLSRLVSRWAACFLFCSTSACMEVEDEWPDFGLLGRKWARRGLLSLISDMQLRLLNRQTALTVRDSWRRALKENKTNQSFFLTMICLIRGRMRRRSNTLCVFVCMCVWLAIRHSKSVYSAQFGIKHNRLLSAGCCLWCPIKNGIYCCLKSKTGPRIFCSPSETHFFSPGTGGAGRLLQQLSGKSSEWLITGRNGGMMWLACPPTCQHITAHVLLIHRAVNQGRTSGKLSWCSVQHLRKWGIP